MKKALNLIIIYFMTLITGVVIGTVLYSFYMNVQNFIAGTEITFFTKNDMLYALFYITFCVLVIICPLISYYKIRHPGGIPQLVSFIILAALTWIVFIPGLFRITDNYLERYYVPEIEKPLSKNYFRQIDDTVYYFTKDFKENKNGELETTAIIINTDAEYKNVKIKEYTDSPNSEIHSAAAPYREILLKNTLRSNDISGTLNFKHVLSVMKSNIYGGLLPFIGYLSLGVVLASVFALTTCFNWKLLNTLLIVIVSVAILIINSCPLFLHIGLIEQKISNSGFFNAISHFGLEPLISFINFILAFIFITIGIVHFIVVKHKEKNN